MQRLLVADYGFNERGSAAFMGQAVEYEIANVVDPSFTVISKFESRSCGADNISPAWDLG